MRILAALVLLAATLSAQTTRYRDPIFATTTTTSNIAYGAAINRFTNQLETLRLDVHEPAGDGDAGRAAFVMVHGGGFVGGDKADAQIVSLCRQLAQRGYFTVSINYRLMPQNQPITAQTITDAKDDAKAAVRYLRANLASYRLDTNRIAIGGSSAGGFTALAVGYITGEGSSGNPGYPSNVRAIVDLWGALLDVNVIETGEAPVCIVHGTNDPTVPYVNATNIHARAQQVGVYSELHPLQGAGHAPWNLTSTFLPEIVTFLWEQMSLVQLAGLAARPGYASPGTLTFDHFGSAGDLVVLCVAGSRVDTPLGSWGTFCLGLPFVALPAITLPATPRVATLPSALSVPAGLVGRSLWWQDADFGGVVPRSFTNCVKTTF